MSWVEQVGETFDIFASAYYGGWQEAINISNSVVESRDPDVVHIPGGMIEGWLMVNYVEGSDAWISRGKYVPLYRLRTYQTMLPLVGGGPQDRNTMPIGALIPELKIYPNPFRNHLLIKFQIPNKKVISNQYSVVSIKIYDVSGRLVKQWDREAIGQSNQIIWDAKDNSGQNVTSGLYFVRLESVSFRQIEKIIFLDK